jgi:hypothetical protein
MRDYDFIYTILSSKPHNNHYLNRYITFLKGCELQNSISVPTYTEKHHICPKSKTMFPEYKNLTQNPWNSVKLTFRQHVLSHYILAKIYNNWECWESVRRALYNNSVITDRSLIINTKTLKLVSDNIKTTKKGVFTRGYDEFGNALVSDSTKVLLSKIKTEYYSDPENRAKAKIIRSRPSYDTVNLISSDRFIELNKSRIGIPLSEQHRLNISSTLKERNKNPMNRPSFNGLYVTPIGIGSSVHSLGGLCIYSQNSDKIINNFITSHSAIFTNKVNGMSFRDLGFYFIPKHDPLCEQLCEYLGQVHLPEPNHVLWSELNDYLLRKKLLL